MQLAKLKGGPRQGPRYIWQTGGEASANCYW